MDEIDRALALQKNFAITQSSDLAKFSESQIKLLQGYIGSVAMMLYYAKMGNAPEVATQQIAYTSGIRNAIEAIGSQDMLDKLVSIDTEYGNLIARIQDKEFRGFTRLGCGL